MDDSLIYMDQFAMWQRFPHFMSLFSYSEDGYINGINKDFIWKTYNYIIIIWYILELAQSSEKNNINKFTNVSYFILRIKKSFQMVPKTKYQKKYYERVIQLLDGV